MRQCLGHHLGMLGGVLVPACQACRGGTRTCIHWGLRLGKVLGLVTALSMQIIALVPVVDLVIAPQIINSY